MAGFFFMHRASCLNLFLNVCFLFLVSYFAVQLYTSDSADFLNSFTTSSDSDNDCKGLQKYHGNREKCSYVKSHRGCQQPLGYISYLYLFYCTFCSPLLGYTALVLWLTLLFYLLGDTAANYFCSSLEGSSRILKLSPTIAGVTLLSLGNGAPDIFASVVSFMGGDSTQDVGLNSILGGAFFVSGVVVGIISICDGNRRHKYMLSGDVCGLISQSSFIRDVLFFLFSLFCLLVIIILGKINLWGAISFLSLYFIYLFIVSASEIRSQEEKRGEIIPSESLPVLPVIRGFLGDKPIVPSDFEAPLLGGMVDERLLSIDLQDMKLQAALDGQKDCTKCSCCSIEFSTSFLGGLAHILEMPLSLLRRLTIPVVTREAWSKPFAVVSVTIAPVALTVTWSPQGAKPGMFTYEVGGAVGILCGVIAYFTTDRSNPPTKCLFLWLGGGFLMSITWTYVLAQELISLLVSLGLILGLNPSILGLTVLAWGNSLGDLAANVTMAKNGGPSGAQVAISGCYAGPIFNTLVGLGFSLTLSAWTQYPSCFIIHKDAFVYETVGFLMAGLLWALVALPKRSMRLDRVLGGGLLAIYLCFLLIKMARTFGFIS